MLTMVVQGSSSGIETESPDINELLGPTKNLSEKWRLVTSYVKTRGLVKQQIESFNYFVTQGMQKILKVERDRYQIETEISKEHSSFFWLFFLLIFTIFCLLSFFFVYQCTTGKSNGSLYRKS